MSTLKYLLVTILMSLIAACGGGGGSAGTLVAGSQPPMVVVPDLKTDVPSGLTMALGVTQSFTISGGTVPYRATASNLQIAIASINGQALTIGSIGTGTSSILISDAAGKSVSIAVVVENSVALYTTAPSTLTVAKDTERAYLVGGGQPGYSVETSDSRIAIPSMVGTNLVIRGINIGSTTVILRDSKGATVSLAVIVGGQNPAGLFTTAPSSLTVAKDSTSSYALGGGTAPYTVTSADVRIASVSSSASSLSVFGVGIGSTQITVRDALGASLNINVTVGGNSPAAFFTNAPTTLAMAAGSTAGSFELRGGVQPYSSNSTDSRIASATVNGNFFTIVAYKKGVATIQLIDATGKALPVAVTVDGSGATGVTSAASIEILSSSGSLNSAPGSSVSFVVTVKDGLNTAVPAQEVVFSASSGTLTGANPTPVTNANGSITSVSLSPGADPSNRSITVSATVGTLSRSIVIPIVGTKLTIAGPGSALSGTSNLLYSVTAVDSSGKPIAGAVLNVTSTSGNAVSSNTVTTDASGAATFTFRPTIAGIYTDTLRVSGLGTTAEASVAISDENFAFVLPAAGAKLSVNTNQTVQVRYISGGVGQPNRDVTFSTTRGGIVGLSTVKTDSSGTATIQINSSTAGPVSISAQSGTARSSLTAAFVALTPATIVLQANPGAIPPNTNGSTVNQSSLSVIVRDASGNPVADQVVNFTAVKDGSNGSIIPGTSTTDSNGSAAVQFIPGALTTAANGVQITATVQKTPSISSTAFLTVSGEALFISIGRANVLTVVDTTTYQKDFQVYVTDANGSPASNRSIVMSLEPVSYGKGILVFGTAPDGSKAWFGGDSTSCANEDINFDGILQPGEDFNGSGRLEPGLPAVVNPGVVTTDAQGFGKLVVRYGKNYARWTRLLLKARSLVGGTESSSSAIYDLEMTAEDAKADGAPANVFSPFGTATSCSSRF